MRLRRAVGPLSDEHGGLSVTTALLTVNGFLFIAALAVGGLGGGGAFDLLTPNIQVMFRLGLQDTAAIDAGHWWRLVLPIFLHLGLLHVAFNCYLLHFAGQLLEADMGSRLLFTLYMVADLSGTIASYVFDIGGAGASGAVMGLLAAILVRRRLLDGDFKHPLSQQLLFLIGINIVFGLFMGGRINHVAHGAGFLAGGLFMWLLSRRRIGRAGAATLLVGSTGIGVTVLAAFVLMTLSLFNGGPSDLMAASRCWQQVGLSVTPDFNPSVAEEAQRCLVDMPNLEPSANELRDSAAGAFQDATRAYDEGDSATLNGAIEGISAAFIAYKSWESEAYPRYGVVMSRR